MKKTQLLISNVLIFCIMILGFSVNGKASDNVDNRNGIEISSADNLPAFNYKTSLILNEFQPGFDPLNVQRRYWLKIRNDSRWNIHLLYMSSAEQEKWGPDQLGNFVLRSGGSFTITDIVPGEYDVMFVDQDRDKCVLRNVQIFKNEDWTITSPWLVKCQKGN